MSFLESVLASILAGILLILLGGFFSQTARWVFTSIFGRILEIDIEFVFRNPRDASQDIVKDLSRASSIRLFTGRGNELQRETFSEAFARLEKGGISEFKVLLPAYSPSSEEPDWIDQREEELAEFDSAYGTGLLRTQIATNVNFLANHVSKNKLELRFYQYPHIGRILITDRVAYFTPYRKDAHGRDCRVIKYRRGGDTYEVLARLFDQLWHVSKKSFNQAPHKVPGEPNTSAEAIV